MPRRIPAAPSGCRPECLKDPCGDRPVKEAALPPAQLLNSDVLFNSKGIPDIALLQAHLSLEGALDQETLLDLIKKASDLFAKEPNLLKLNDPITVVGDIHGQYYDLVKLLEVGGPPGDGQYIFLGDYVDRGSFSIEAAALLFAYKIAYPKRVRMLRGNHECRQMTSFFNFREECEYKYDESVYNAFMDAFDTLPLAATINGKFLALHGGLSPDLASLKGITSLDRFLEPPREGPLCDLIWSDPYEKDDLGTSKKGKNKDNWFIPNQVRGCSYFYTFDYVNRFLQKNSLLSIIRAHEAQLEGYKMHKTNPTTGFPSVITIFSAPNYCDVYNNKGAILKFDNSTLNVLQFNCSPHPYHLPNFMDIFAWSMPFVIEKVTEMLYYILQPSVNEVADAEEGELPLLPQAMQQMIRRDSLTEEEMRTVQLASQLAQRVETGEKRATGVNEETADARDRMRKKVRTIARMARMFKTLRQENETVLRLKGVCPGHRLQAGLLLAGKDKLNSELERFDHATDVDLVNEQRPQHEAPATPATNVRIAIDREKLQQGDSDEELPGNAGEEAAAAALPPFRLAAKPA